MTTKLKRRKRAALPGKQARVRVQRIVSRFRLDHLDYWTAYDPKTGESAEALTPMRARLNLANKLYYAGLIG